MVNPYITYPGISPYAGALGAPASEDTGYKNCRCKRTVRVNDDWTFVKGKKYFYKVKDNETVELCCTSEFGRFNIPKKDFIDDFVGVVEVHISINDLKGN